MRFAGGRTRPPGPPDDKGKSPKKKGHTCRLRDCVSQKIAENSYSMAVFARVSLEGKAGLRWLWISLGPRVLLRNRGQLVIYLLSLDLHLDDFERSFSPVKSSNGAIVDCPNGKTDER